MHFTAQPAAAIQEVVDDPGLKGLGYNHERVVVGADRSDEVVQALERPRQTAVPPRGNARDDCQGWGGLQECGELRQIGRVDPPMLVGKLHSREVGFEGALLPAEIVLQRAPARSRHAAPPEVQSMAIAVPMEDHD